MGSFVDSLTLDLESAIDSVGLESILIRLSEIATLKGFHVSDIWHDGDLAKAWHRSAGIIESVATRIPDSCRGI